ncbi:ABC transporter permease [Pseudooceanicola sp. 502str34]|uniref:ABC transporter permease n=1 Tax=Maritimibacter alkaliphilus TaxID=404236 RepID=UPI001C967223|nr:ABC transporter permease [Maritimibacter alkaliphilus]MBY6089861.1 ABC transporter permease [Maritimibacter alkaliphilus]
MSATDTSTTASPPDTTGGPGAFLRRYAGVGAALVVLIVFLSLTQENFLKYNNIMNILRTNAVMFVAAVGLTFVIVSQGLDLSVGSMTALGGVILAELLTSGVGAWPAIVLTILACTALGALVNGGLIAYGGFNFFVVTLAMLQLLRGAALVLSNGSPTSTFMWAPVQWVGDGRIGALPVPVLIAALIGVIGYAVMRWTRFGRAVYAVGGNETAARLAGIDVRRVRLTVYAISAACAGVSAVMLTGRLTSSQPVSAAVGLELSAAAAVLLGGASFAGGSGNIGGAAIGVLFLGVLANGITLAGVPSYWQGIATGLVLIAAIALDRIRAK